MPWFDIFWTPDAEAHLAAHAVSLQEFQEVLFAAQTAMIESSHTNEQYQTVEGVTSAGRRLRIVSDLLDAVTVFPVTAYEVE